MSYEYNVLAAVRRAAEN